MAYISVHADKTEILIPAPPSLVPKIRDSLGSLTSSLKSSIRNLGITMDQAQTLDQHVKCLIRSCSFQLRNIAKLRPTVSQEETELLILSRLP